MSESDNTVQRLFTAITLPDPTRGDIRRLLGRFRREGVRAGLIRPENLHISLQFFGDLPGAILPLLQQKLLHAAEAGTPFDLQLGGLNFFGAPRVPRVVWLETSKPNDFSALAANIRKAALACEIPLGERPFTPHLTLARIRCARHRDPMRHALKTIRLPVITPFHVNSFHLLRCTLTDNGPLHTRIAEFPL